MSAIISLMASEARELFGTLSYLLPSKSEATPIGLQLTHSILTITLNNGYVAVYSKDVNNTDEWETTFMYQDIHPLLSYSEDLTIECDQYGVTVQCAECQCTFPVAYSTVGKQEFDNYRFHQMPEIKESAIKLLLKLSLEKTYKAVYPVYIRGGIAIVKYPSFYAQVRMAEPYDSISMSLTHWSIIDKFCPTSYSQDNPQCLILRKSAWTLMFPCTTSQQDNTFVPLLSDMEKVLQLNLHDLTETVRVMARAKGVDYCDISLYHGGLIVTTSNSNVRTSIRFGDTSGEMVKTCTVPTAVWLSMLNAVGDASAEILLGGGKLCLRNHTIAMLLRVAA